MNPDLRPIAMAMHIHASFSEGRASYETHLQQARQHGVDVIWWTDHDFRVAAHEHRRAVRFDGPTEREGELEWSWAEIREGELASGSAQFVDKPRSPDEPGSALRLHATGGPGGGRLWYAGTSWNWTYSVSLADTTVQLDVLAEQCGPDAVLVLRIESSYHPARAGRPAGQYVVEYRIGGVATPRHSAEDCDGIVELPAPVGTWHRLTLRPVDDIALLWPDLIAEDNSLHQLRVGVLAGAEQRARFVVDRLRFDRGKGTGASALQLRREILARYAAEYPDVTHYEALEMSLVRHLNWIGGEPTLAELPVPPYRDNDVDLAVAMVEFMHSHGALVQWNHPLDVESPESLARLMIERDNLGADLVEIGRERLDDALQVFDTAARNAIFFTAVGVSDDHHGEDWLDQRSPWITYVWAASTRQTDLLHALRSGSAWFCDPNHWRGQLDIVAGASSALGRVTVTDASTVAFDVLASDLPPDGSLEIIIGRVDCAGPAQPVADYESQRVPATDLGSGRHHVEIAPGDGCYVRTQVRTADGTIVGVSNPFWILRREPPAVPEARRLSALR